MSQIDGTSEVIDGVTYEVKMLPPRQSLKLLTRVIKMVLPAFGPIADAYQGKGDLQKVLDQDLGSDFFSRAASALAMSLDENLLAEICTAMAAVSFADGKHLKQTFDFHFQERLDSMVKWVAFAMKVQWGPTLSGLIGMAGQQAAQIVPMASRSQSTSTG